MIKVPEEIEKELKRLGVPWSVENGKKHIVLRVRGKMVTVLPRSGGRKTGYVARNVMASIRRAAR